MKNSELWEDYKLYTNSLTQFARHLAYANGAICWFFKDADKVTFPPPVLASLSCLVLFFAFDVLQSWTALILIRVWTRREEVRLGRAGQSVLLSEYKKPWFLDLPPFVFFNIKLAVLLAAFVFLGLQFFDDLRGP